jgi:hypothetical protein
LNGIIGDISFMENYTKEHIKNVERKKGEKKKINNSKRKKQSKNVSTKKKATN